MKIISLSINWRDPSVGITPFRSHYQHLHEGLAKVEDVVFYGVGDGYNPETDVAKIVKEEKPDILFFHGKQTRYKNIKKVKIPKFIFCSDPWSNMFKHVEFMEQNKFTGAMMLYPSAILPYSKHTKRKLYPLPYAVDLTSFRDLGLERTIDIFCSGSFDTEAHPLRYKLLQLHRRYNDIKFFLGEGHSLNFRDYIRKLNQTKILCFDNVYLHIPRYGDPNAPRIRFAIEKWVEAMACKMLAMAPTPTYARGLYFKHEFNFVDINMGNMMEQIRKYLKDEDERTRIINNGYETVVKYHTIKTRVKQLVKFFEEALRGD